jgi:hypothetical protein
MCRGGGRTGEEGGISGVNRGRQTKMVEEVLGTNSAIGVCWYAVGEDDAA